MTAVARDLQEVDLADISGSMLKLGDHQHFWPANGAKIEQAPRGAQRYLSDGRKLLAHLGCWPWAHTAAGWGLPKGWRQRQDIVEPLAAWHRSAIQESQRSIEHARSAWR